MAYDLYPSDRSMNASSGELEWLGTFRPDRLAEQLVVSELCDSSEFADSCLSSGSPPQGFRATALLGRARVEDPQADPSSKRFCRGCFSMSHHPDLVDADAIMMVADLIRHSALRLLYTSNALRRHYDKAPWPGSSEWKPFLAKLSDYLAKTMRRLENFPPANPDEGAYKESMLARAFPPIESKSIITLRKDLETYPNLAGNLSRFRSVDSLEEAAAIYRGLAEVYPDRYILKLARTLMDLRQGLSRDGRDTEAQEVRVEAARLRETWKVW